MVCTDGPSCPAPPRHGTRGRRTMVEGPRQAGPQLKTTQIRETMMRRYVTGIVVVFAVVFLPILPLFFAGNLEGGSVKLEDLREEVGKSICIEARVIKGKEYLGLNIGDRTRCDLPAPSVPIEKVIKKAFDEASFLVSSLGLYEKVLPALEGKEGKERNAVARDICLKDGLLLETILPRIENALADFDLTCPDCSEVKPRPVRKIAWADLVPYLEAYFWPDPVRDRLDENGEPTGRKQYSFHICGGINGISEMKDPDPDLVRAGFVLVFESSKVIETSGDHFSAALQEMQEEGIESNEMQTSFLRKRFPKLVFSDPQVKEAVCRKVQDFGKDLAIEVRDCH